jgi:hypothetical protein
VTALTVSAASLPKTAFAAIARECAARRRCGKVTVEAVRVASVRGTSRLSMLRSDVVWPSCATVVPSTRSERCW